MPAVENLLPEEGVQFECDDIDQKSQAPVKLQVC